ncbi:MAG: hypothetical protein ACYDCP_07355 [Thermoplasmataceae archaeon]
MHDDLFLTLYHGPKLIHHPQIFGTNKRFGLSIQERSSMSSLE